MFYILGVVAQLIQGGCGAIIILVSFALLSLTYKEKMELMHNLFQIGITLGLASSPFIGSFVYKAFGFSGAFVAAAIISAPPILLPLVIKNREFEIDEAFTRSTMKVILKNKRAMMTYAYYGMTSVLLSTLQTCLSDRLMTIFNFKANEVAVYFFLFFLGALICSLICALMPQRVDKAWVILVSLFLCAISMLLIGPSSILHIPITK